MEWKKLEANRYEGYEKKNILRLMNKKKRNIVHLETNISGLKEDIQMLEKELQRLIDFPLREVESDESKEVKNTDDNNLIYSIKKTVMDYYSQPKFEDKRQNAFYRFYDSKIKEVSVDIENKIVVIILHRKSKFSRSQIGRMVGRKGTALLPLIALIQEEYGDEWEV